MKKENLRKQLRDFQKQGKGLKYLINYMHSQGIDDEGEILEEMKKIGHAKDDIIECLEYDFAIDMREYYEYIPSSTNGDYSPSNPWDAPGMKLSDFI